MVRSNKKLNFTPPFKQGAALVIKTRYISSSGETTNDAEIMEDINGVFFYDIADPHSYNVLINVESFGGIYFGNTITGATGKSPRMKLIGDYGTAIDIPEMSNMPTIRFSDYLSDIGEIASFISFGGDSSSAETKSLGQLSLMY